MSVRVLHVITRLTVGGSPENTVSTVVALERAGYLCTLAVSFRDNILPWAPSLDDDARFRRVLHRVLALVVVLCLIMLFMPAPQVDRKELQEPPRLAIHTSSARIATSATAVSARNPPRYPPGTKSGPTTTRPAPGGYCHVGSPAGNRPARRISLQRW